MKKGLVFISALLIISLVFNIFQYIDEKNHTEYENSFELGWSEERFIDRTVEIYDSFIRSKMGDELPIGEAYRRFFAENGAKAESAADAVFFMPDSTFVYEWTYKLIGNSEFNSLVGLRYITPDDRRNKYPGGWGFDIKHPYFVEFGRKIGENNNFWTDFADSIEASGGFSPTCYAAVIQMSENINFDNKEERFMAAIIFMNGCFDHRDFNLVKDVQRNDSLKIAWNNYDWDIE